MHQDNHAGDRFDDEFAQLNDEDNDTSFAYLSQSGTMKLFAKPGVIPFGDPPILSEDMHFSKGVLHLTTPGIYYASMTLALPATNDTEYMIFIQCDGEAIDGTIYHRTMPLIPDGECSISAQSLFAVDGEAALRVVVSSPMQVVAPAQDDVIATLATLRLQ